MVSSLVVSAASAAPLVPPAPVVPSAERVGAFDDAMARGAAGHASAVQSGEVAASGRPAPVSSASVSDLDAQARARRGLGLDGVEAAAPAAGGGDMILGGLQKLRGIFDAREARISDVMNAGPMDTGAMMSLQMEVTNFTLLVDLTSKLTGKSTAAFETLMKGQ